MEPERLTSTIRNAIETEPELVLSVASLWELTIKHAAGNIRIEGSLETFRQTVTQKFGTELVIRPEYALTAAGLPLHHRDPFDRMLVAQATTDNLTLVTADEMVRNYGGDLLWVGS